MIEVTIWWGNTAGDSASRYLIDRPTDGDVFCASNYLAALRRALTEFEAEVHTRDAEYGRLSVDREYRGGRGASISRIHVRTVPDRVLQP